MAQKNTEVATTNGGYLVEYAGDMDSLSLVISENLGDTGISPRELPRIRIPAGGGRTWEVPTLEGIESRPAITGTIVHWKTLRAFWDTPFEQSDGGPPRCSSDDGIIGIGDPGVACKTCMFNQFGTAKGGEGTGKACREARAVFLLTPGDTLPYFMPMPPMSISPIRDYFARLTQRGIPFWGVETTLELEQSKNRANITYSRVLPKLARQLSEEEFGRMRTYRESIKPAIDGTKLTQEDVTYGVD